MTGSKLTEKILYLPKRAVLKIEDLLYLSLTKAKSYLPTNIKMPFQVIFVPVEKINKIVVSQDQLGRRKKFLVSHKRVIGSIKGGDWDLHTVMFEDSIDMLSIKQRYLEGKNWEETDYFQKFNHEFEYPLNHLGETWTRGAESWSEYRENYLKKIDYIFNDMKENEYKTQNELGGRAEKEIEVAISRNKEVLFIDGRHRLAMAKVLGVEYVPCIVNVWHEKIIKDHSAFNLVPSEIITKIGGFR